MEEKKQFRTVLKFLAIFQIILGLVTIEEGVRCLIIWRYYPVLTGLAALSGSYACFKLSIRYKMALAKDIREAAELKLYSHFNRRGRRAFEQKLKKDLKRKIKQN